MFVYAPVYHTIRARVASITLAILLLITPNSWWRHVCTRTTRRLSGRGFVEHVLRSFISKVSSIANLHSASGTDLTFEKFYLYTCRRHTSHTWPRHRWALHIVRHDLFTRVTKVTCMCTCPVYGVSQFFHMKNVCGICLYVPPAHVQYAPSTPLGPLWQIRHDLCIRNTCARKTHRAPCIVRHDSFTRNIYVEVPAACICLSDIYVYEPVAHVKHGPLTSLGFLRSVWDDSFTREIRVTYMDMWANVDICVTYIHMCGNDICLYT